MDDLKPIIYIIFVVIFLISRVIKGAKKFQEGQSQPPRQTPPPVTMPPTPVFTEIKKPAPPKPKTEIKQKVVVSERKAKTERAKREVMPGSIEQTEPLTIPIEHFEKETGLSGIPDRWKQKSSEAKVEQPTTFEFDPREAFMMKTLLDRHPSV